MSAGGTRRADRAAHRLNGTSWLIADGHSAAWVRFLTPRRAIIAVAFAGICILLTTPAPTLDLNSLPPRAASGALVNAAYSHAHSLAARQPLDHAGFRQRVPQTSGTAAENVSAA